MRTKLISRQKVVLREGLSKPIRTSGAGFAIAAGLLVAFFTFIIETPRAVAQPDRSPCLNVDTGGTAAEQALCWFERDRRGSPECQPGRAQVSSCISHALAWCSDAELDAASVADACFLAYLRAGQLEDALVVAGYLQTPAEEARRCREALAAVTVRVISNPPGAQITVDGKRYGRAPVEIKLIGNWWTKKITAAFDAANSERTEVHASREQLVGAFDKRACIMGDLLIEGPAASEPTPELQPIAQEPLAQTKPPRGPFEGRLWTWVALGGAGAFGVTALVFRLVGDNQFDDLHNDLDKQCPNGCKDKVINKAIDDSGVKTTNFLTNLSLGLSGACLAGAVVLYFLESGATVESPAVVFGAGPGSLYLRGEF